MKWELNRIEESRIFSNCISNQLGYTRNSNSIIWKSISEQENLSSWIKLYYGSRQEERQVHIKKLSMHILNASKPRKRLVAG